jgi:hypothetical protein
MSPSLCSTTLLTFHIGQASWQRQPRDALVVCAGLTRSHRSSLGVAFGGATRVFEAMTPRNQPTTEDQL